METRSRRLLWLLLVSFSFSQNLSCFIFTLHCLAIVPAEDVFPNWAKSIGASAGSFKDLIATETIRSAFQKEIEQFGRANGLSGFEIPKGVFLDHVAWSAENNLVTPTLKGEDQLIP